MDISHLCLVTNLGSLSVSLRLSGEDGFGIDASVYLLKGTQWNRAAFTLECVLRPETNCASTIIFTVADNYEEFKMAEAMGTQALKDEVARLNALAHSIMREREDLKLKLSKCLNRPYGPQKRASLRDAYQSHFFLSSINGENRGGDDKGDVDTRGNGPAQGAELLHHQVAKGEDRRTEEEDQEAGIAARLVVRLTDILKINTCKEFDKASNGLTISTKEVAKDAHSEPDCFVETNDKVGSKGKHKPEMALTGKNKVLCNIKDTNNDKVVLMGVNRPECADEGKNNVIGSMGDTSSTRENTTRVY